MVLNISGVLIHILIHILEGGEWNEMKDPGALADAASFVTLQNQLTPVDSCVN